MRHFIGRDHKDEKLKGKMEEKAQMDFCHKPCHQPRHAIKAQALADFIAEFTPSYEDLNGVENRKKWVVHVDGSSTQHTGGIGVVLLSSEGDK